ncbi:hypothetical protein BJ742DRAFT_142705 [Cladochytrium replicatum]|nr:hypothetical protein BJ742DRAFT_142705 [Cladochytrium replicatum]
MNGKQVLILGITGNIGSAAVSGLLNAGATVHAPVRATDASSLRLPALISPSNERLHLLYGYDLSKWEDAQRLKEKLGSVDLDHVIASIGPWHRTPKVHEMSFEQYRNALAANVDTHFIAYRTFASQILQKPGSLYLIVNGAAKDMPGAGITSVTAATLHALSRTIAVQTSDALGGVLEMVLHLRVEEDQTFEKMYPNAKDWSDNDATHSRVFGQVFPKLLESGKRGTFALDSKASFLGLVNP